MKRILLGTVAALGLAGSAVAADMTVKAQPLYQNVGAPGISWAGLYAGIYGVYAANITNTDFSNGIGSFGDSPRGPGIGGQIGYNWQPWGPSGLVFGVRGDLAYVNVTGSGSLANALQFSNATNYLGDIDFLFGIPINHILLYADGGWAFGGAKPNLALINTSAGANTTSTGWNAGLGIAYQFTPSWQIFIEGDYFQLGDQVTTLPGGVLSSTNKYHFFEQQVGFKYKFN